MLQDPLLFNDTVRANIAYARPTAGSAEIEAAARTAHAVRRQHRGLIPTDDVLGAPA